MGAGTILRDGGRNGGLTTAATIWLAAALGMGIAANETEEVLMATAIALIVLLVFPRIVSWIDRIRDARTYKIVISSGNPDKKEKLRRAFKDSRLEVVEDHVHISDKSIVTSWFTFGTLKNQEKFVRLMIREKGICSLEY